MSFKKINTVGLPVSNSKIKPAAQKNTAGLPLIQSIYDWTSAVLSRHTKEISKLIPNNIAAKIYG